MMKSIELYKQNPDLSVCEAQIEAALDLMISTYKKGGKLLICGNGGSCADCDHIVGELMKGFLLRREPSRDFVRSILDTGAPEAELLSANLQMGLPAIALHTQSALLSAFCNDVSAETVYAQALLALAKPEDLLICFSTSGNSKNVVAAAVLAKALGIPVVSLTGARESRLSALSTVTIQAPATDTYRVQEYHLPIYHYLCAEIEREFFGK